MEKTNKNEELQSRREFFKKAAKGALPILAAVALAGAPNIIRAAEGGCPCEGNCTGKCYGNCVGTCRTDCQRTCSGWCSETCKGHCKGANKN